MSAKIGVAPTYLIGLTAALQVNACIITSSPALIFIAFKIAINELLPLLKAKAFLNPK